MWLHNKFKWMSFIATWAVFCIHSLTNRWTPGVKDLGNLLQLHLNTYFEFAVPLFFVSSGYFFIEPYQKYGWQGMGVRKVRSLYVPAVIWLCISIVICLPICMYAHHAIPSLATIAGIPLLLVEGTSAQRFWYIRSLLLLLLMAPLLSYCGRRWWSAVSLVVLAVFLPTWLVHVGDLSLRMDVALFFFSFGMILRELGWLEKGDFFGREHLRPWALCGIAISFTLIILMEIGVFQRGRFVWPGALGLLIWLMYGVVDNWHPMPVVKGTLDCCFVVYCMHLMVICWVAGAFRMVLGTSASMRFLVYLLLWRTFWLDVALANAIKGASPRVYRLLSGGR